MNPTEVFIHLNNEIHLRRGELEQQAQRRLNEAIQKLLEFKKGEAAIEWLKSPCVCNICRNQPRWQLILNEYSYQHLLEQITAAKGK